MSHSLLLEEEVSDGGFSSLTSVYIPQLVGVSVLRRAFPEIKIVTAGVDDMMQEGWLEGSQGEGNPSGRQVWAMIPGFGQMGEFSCVFLSSEV